MNDISDGYTHILFLFFFTSAVEYQLSNLLRSWCFIVVGPFWVHHFSSVTTHHFIVS